METILQMPFVNLVVIVLVVLVGGGALIAFLLRFDVVRDAVIFIKESAIIIGFLVLVAVLAWWLFGYGSWLAEGLGEAYDALPRWGD